MLTTRIEHDDVLRQRDRQPQHRVCSFRCGVARLKYVAQHEHDTEGRDADRPPAERQAYRQSGVSSTGS